jgi:hypothetical protein
VVKLLTINYLPTFIVGMPGSWCTAFQNSSHFIPNIVLALRLLTSDWELRIVRHPGAQLCYNRKFCVRVLTIRVANARRQFTYVVSCVILSVISDTLGILCRRWDDRRRDSRLRFASIFSYVVRCSFSFIRNLVTASV